MEVFDITNKSSQSLGTSLNRGSTVIALFTKVTKTGNEKRGTGTGILGFGIRNSTQGIRNPDYDWNLESKFYGQGILNPISGIWNLESGILIVDS